MLPSQDKHSRSPPLPVHTQARREVWWWWFHCFLCAFQGCGVDTRALCGNPAPGKHTAWAPGGWNTTTGPCTPGCWGTVPYHFTWSIFWLVGEPGHSGSPPAPTTPQLSATPFLAWDVRVWRAQFIPSCPFFYSSVFPVDAKTLSVLSIIPGAWGPVDK